MLGGGLNEWPDLSGHLDHDCPAHVFGIELECGTRWPLRTEGLKRELQTHSGISAAPNQDISALVVSLTCVRFDA